MPAGRPRRRPCRSPYRRLRPASSCCWSCNGTSSTNSPGGPGAANSLNFCIESASPAADWVAQATGPAQIVTYPVCTGANSLGADPVLILALGNPANATAPTVQETLNIAIQLVSG